MRLNGTAAHCDLQQRSMIVIKFVASKGRPPMLRMLLLSAVLMLTTPSLAEHPPVVDSAPPIGSSPLFDVAPAPAPEECCKVCHKGKACGDTCIARDKICRAGPGCACDG